MIESGKSARGLVLAGVLLLSLGGAWAEEPGAGSRNPPPFVLSVKDATLSAKIDNIPLGEVLKELARQAHLEIYVGKASAENKISADFDNLPLEEGIKRLLKGRNFILTNDPSATAPKVTKIKIIEGAEPLSRIGEQPAAAAPSAGDQSVEELAQQALQAPDPAARIAALKALSQGGEEEKISATMSAALQDKDLGVRTAALELAQTVAPVSEEAIQRMALHDADPELRMRALDELTDRSDPVTAIENLQQALRDPDPRVAGLAESLILRVEEAKQAQQQEE